jgi:predicted nucleic acid-binding Zn ribbon protein
MERLGDDARRLLAAAGAGGTHELSAVIAVWRDCVGEVIARAAWPGRISRDGTLHVATASSAWAFELERLTPEIAGRLHEALGGDAPQALRFAPGRVPERDFDPAVDLAEAPRITAELRAEGETIAAAIEDSELRELVARAAAASLARAGSDRGFC